MTKDEIEIIKKCIELLSVDGANTKHKVADLLKGLVKNA